MSRHHLPPGDRRPIHGFQIKLFNKAVPQGWIAAGDDTFDAASEALRYLDQVWNPETHTKASLLKNGKVIEDNVPVRAA